MSRFQPYPTLSARIKAGQRLHAFMSGGGLRVVDLHSDTLDTANGGYGEHPYIYEALEYAEEDAAAGGREYKEVYGEGKLHLHYLTGDPNPSGGLDAWVRCGRDFDVVFEDGNFVFRGKFLKHRNAPQWVVDALKLDEVKANYKPPYGVVTFDGPQVNWEEAGYQFVTQPCGFCTGAVGHLTKCLNPKEGDMDYLMYHVNVEFLAPTLQGLLDLVEAEFLQYDKWRS
jgi:hypothetical protein